MIVDDSDDILMLLRVLAEQGSDDVEVVAEAGDGETAIAKWRETRPDVVILDQSMPGTSGLDVARLILAERADQPIILFSAYLTDPLLASAEELGIRECLWKDRYAELPAAIARLIG